MTFVTPCGVERVNQDGEVSAGRESQIFHSEDVVQS